MTGGNKGLRPLAFDERFPAAITSTVGRRNIRYARLKSAVRYEATQRNFDRLVHLLLELSTITAVDQRGAEYILGCPDLVTAAKDADATRRLFETRGAWQGTRHARLAIAYALSGEADEAYRHAASTQEWIDHHLEQKHEDRVHEPGPEGLDIAAIPFVLVTQKEFDKAFGWMRRWRDWFAYEVNVILLSLIDQAKRAASGFILDDQVLIGRLSESISGTVAALSYLEIDHAARKELVVNLSKTCKKAAPEIPNAPPGSSGYALKEGLRKAAAPPV